MQKQPEINIWTHPRTGQIREYINNWPELVGVEIYRYKTGNISGAYLDGEKFSNARAREVLYAKVWRGEEGEIHVDHLSSRAAAVITSDEIAKRISETLLTLRAERKLQNGHFH